MNGLNLLFYYNNSTSLAKKGQQAYVAPLLLLHILYLFSSTLTQRAIVFVTGQLTRTLLPMRQALEIFCPAISSVLIYRLSISTVLLLLSECALAQQLLIDSLQMLVQQAPSDTARISALCTLAEKIAMYDRNDSVARLKAYEAYELVTRLPEKTYRSVLPYYRAQVFKTLGSTYCFARMEKRPLGDGYFRSALDEARAIPDVARSLAMQFETLQSWFTGIRFRIEVHSKDDKPREELYREATSLQDTAQAIADKLNNDTFRGDVALNRGIVLARAPTQSLILCMQAASLYEKSGNAERQAAALSFAGHFAFSIADYPRAMQAHQRIVRLYDSVKIHNSIMAVTYYNIADIYLLLGDTAKALMNYLRAESFSEGYDVRHNRITLLRQIGSLYLCLDSADRARHYLNRAALLCKEQLYDPHNHLFLAQIYHLQDSTSAALKILHELLYKIEKLSPQYLLYAVFRETALIHKTLAMGYKKQARYKALYLAMLDSAMLYAQKSLAILTKDKVESDDKIVSAYTLLYELSKERGDSAQALVYHEHREVWKEKIFSTEKYQAIAAMESRAVIEAYEARLQNLQIQERLQSAIAAVFGVTAGALVIIVGLLSWRFLERKRLIEKLEQQNQQLLALNTEKNELMGIVAHDLKNPIGAVRGMAEILSTDCDSRQNVRTISQQIFATSERMLELVMNILDVNHLESGARNFHLVPVPVLPILESAVWQYYKPAEVKAITIHLSTNIPSQASVLADEQALFQVLDNLISNAVKYSPHSKNIDVCAAMHNGTVRIAVRDEGPGISESDMQKLFGKFVRLSAQPTGGENSTGLGLSIVKKLVEGMNGRVWCESEFGKGATFIVELPAA